MVEIIAGWGDWRARQLPLESVENRGLRGRMAEIGENEGKTGLNGRNRGGAGKILRPPASGSIRGYSWHRWAEDGGLEINREKREENLPKWRKLWRILADIASVYVRGGPWAPAACVGGRWRMWNY